jgi:phage gp29-like protein
MNPPAQVPVIQPDATQVESKFLTPAVVKQVRRSRFNPLRNLTPQLLSTQLDTFNAGYLRDFALMGDAIRHRDDMISVALAKREKSVSRRGYQILINDGLDPKDSAMAEKHQAALKYFFDHCSATNALDRNQSGGFRLLVQQMMSAVGSRYAAHELVWEPRIDPQSGEQRLTATFIQVPLWFFENLTGRLRFVQNYFGSIEGQPMDPQEWLITVGEGLMEPLAVAYMFKHMSLQDWNAYNEKFGTPGLLGKTSAAQGSAGWDAMVDAVESFSQDWAAVVNLDAQIELIEAKGGANGIPFPPLIERMDRAIVTICRGADLSTMSAGSGKGQGASLQGDEGELLEEDDAELMTETLSGISRQVIEWLFGTDTPLAYVKIIVPRRQDSADVINKLNFCRSSGIAVSQSFARQELGIPPPSEGEELLTVATAPLPFIADPSAKLAANAASPDRAALFRAQAQAQLSRAQAEALQPLTDRLSEILGMEDEAAQDSALIKLQQDMPGLLRKINADKQLVQTWENILGTALANGAVDAAQTQKKSK